MKSQRPVYSSTGEPWLWEHPLALPVPSLGVRNQRTHAVAVLRDGRIVLFHQALPSVLIYAPEGELIDKWGCYPGAHGLTLIERDGEELLWLTDEALGTVELVDLHGNIRQRLEKPQHPTYTENTFAPTWVAEVPGDSKGGRIWVADGYGAGLVHAYDREGCYSFSLSGEEGAGRFHYPHGIAVDPRPGRDHRLLIADRSNCRIQEFDREGNFLGAWGQEFLHSPNGFSFSGDRIVISELFGSVDIIDRDNELTTRLGDQPNARHLKNWPQVNRDDCLRPGLFNSPHHAAWGHAGEIYVVEWIKGGRITRLSQLNGE